VVAPPMRLFYFLTKPLMDLFNGLGNLLLKPFGIPPAREDQELTDNVFAFGDRRVREVMTPRGEIAFLTSDDDLRGAIALAIETGHTRLPLGTGPQGLTSRLG
jgi:CBS domain containing-hemolysin-like protein